MSAGSTRPGLIWVLGCGSRMSRLTTTTSRQGHRDSVLGGSPPRHPLRFQRMDVAASTGSSKPRLATVKMMGSLWTSSPRRGPLPRRANRASSEAQMVASRRSKTLEDLPAIQELDHVFRAVAGCAVARAQHASV